MKHYLVFLAVGPTDYLNEALFSLLTFYKENSNSDILKIIYTDNPDFYQTKVPPDIIIRPILFSELEQWKGPYNFINRIKIKVLQDVTQRFSGSFLFVDSDTVFRKNISAIFSEIDKGSLFFDKSEGVLAYKTGGIAKKTRKALQKQSSFAVDASEKVVFDDFFVVWNSGVIGFNSSYSDILKPAEALTDQLYALNNLFVMEQVALSYFFQTKGDPKSAENHIHHYWYFKEFRSVLSDFFKANHAKTFSELATEASKLNPETMAIPKLAYKQKNFLEKTFQKMFYGYKWKIPKYPITEISTSDSQ